MMMFWLISFADWKMTWPQFGANAFAYDIVS